MDKISCVQGGAATLRGGEKRSERGNLILVSLPFARFGNLKINVLAKKEHTCSTSIITVYSVHIFLVEQMIMKLQMFQLSLSSK